MAKTIHRSDKNSIPVKSIAPPNGNGQQKQEGTQISMDKPTNLVLQPTSVVLVLRALKKMPYEEVEQTILTIEQQVIAQHAVQQPQPHADS